MWNLKKINTNELIYKTETDSQTWKTHMASKGKGGEGRYVRSLGLTDTHYYIK